jgi:hypothetical protein
VAEPTQEQRKLHYAAVLIDETGLDKDAIAAMVPDAKTLTILKAMHERGVDLYDVQAWIAQCDPPGTPPGMGPVDCFRVKAHLALKDPVNVTRSWPISAGFWFAMAFGASWLLRR